MTAQIVHNTFENQEKVDAFEEICDHKLDIKFHHPQITTKHIMQAYGMELSQIDR